MPLVAMPVVHRGTPALQRAIALPRRNGGCRRGSAADSVHAVGGSQLRAPGLPAETLGWPSMMPAWIGRRSRSLGGRGDQIIMQAPRDEVGLPRRCCLAATWDTDD